MEQYSQEELWKVLNSRVVALKEFTAQLQEYQYKSRRREMKEKLKKLTQPQGLLIKSIILNGNWLFRVFSDTLYYTQSRYKEIKFSLNSFVQNNHKQLSKFLSSFDTSEWALENYISQLMVGNWDFEVTLALLWELFNKNAEIYFQSLPNTQLPKTNFSNLEKGEDSTLFKFSLYPPSGASDHRNVGEVVELPVTHFPLEQYQEDTYEGEFRPTLKLPFFWFADFAGILVLSDRTQDLKFSTNSISYFMVSNQVINFARDIAIDIVNKVTWETQNETDDDEFEFECFGITDDTPNSNVVQDSNKTERQVIDSKPKTYKNPKVLIDEPKSYKQDLSNICTPNTTSNSSMSGSNKFIGVLSKLNTKAQVYRANTSRSSNAPKPSPITQSKINAQSSLAQGINFSKQEVKEDKHVTFQKSDQYRSNKFEGFSTVFFTDKEKKQKSKSHISQLCQRFSSDTKINPDKEFKLFGEGIEELDFSNNNMDSDEEDYTGRMAICIPENILDDTESPNATSKFFPNHVDDIREHEGKDLDCGSVSSGSEKDEEVNLKRFQSNKNMQLSHQQMFPKQYSPDFCNSNQKIKEVQSYNSSKLVPSSKLGPIFEEEYPQKVNPNKGYANQLGTSPVNQGYGFSNQSYSNSYVMKGNMYPMLGYNYQPMPMGNPSGYYYHGSMPVYNVPLGAMYSHQYLQPSEHAPHLKTRSDNMIQKQTPLSNKNIAMSCKTSKMMGHSAMHAETDYYNQSISQFQGAPGFENNYVFNDPTKGGKLHSSNQFSSSLLPSNFGQPQRQSDSKLIQPNNLGLKMVHVSKEESQNFKGSSKMIATPQPMIKKINDDKSISSPTPQGEVGKKSKNKKGKRADKRKREKMTGRLKFFDEAKNYGFFVIDQTQQDMFVHYDDLKKTMICKDLLSSSKDRYSMHFTFHVFEYSGK
jgi:hypothetical protein